MSIELKRSFECDKVEPMNEASARIPASRTEAALGSLAPARPPARPRKDWRLRDLYLYLQGRLDRPDITYLPTHGPGAVSLTPVPAHTTIEPPDTDTTTTSETPTGSSHPHPHPPAPDSPPACPDSQPSPPSSDADPTDPGPGDPGLSAPGSSGPGSSVGDSS